MSDTRREFCEESGDTEVGRAVTVWAFEEGFPKTVALRPEG